MQTPVIELIAKERERQIAKGWTPEHDDKEHIDGWLADTAAAVLTQPRGNVTAIFIVKRHPRIEQLTIAAALVVEEIERLQRLEATSGID